MILCIDYSDSKISLFYPDDIDICEIQAACLLSEPVRDDRIYMIIVQLSDEDGFNFSYLQSPLFTLQCQYLSKVEKKLCLFSTKTSVS